MKKFKQRLPLILSLLLILVGIGVLLYPVVANQLASAHRYQVVDETKDYFAKRRAEYKKKKTLMADYNKYIYAHQNSRYAPKVTIDQIFPDNEQVAMGSIDVPAISIKKMPFYFGTSDQTLNKGLGVFAQGSLPVGGKNTHAVITGHSGIENQIYFDNIGHLKLGDVFYVTTFGKKYAYQVYKKEVVLPDQIHKTDIKSGEDSVTLLTCTPVYFNTHRMLVTGKRIPLKRAEKKVVEKRDVFTYQNIALAITALLILLIIIFLIVRRHRAKKRRQKGESHDQK